MAVASSAIAMVGGKKGFQWVPATQREAGEGKIPASAEKTVIVDLKDEEE